MNDKELLEQLDGHLGSPNLTWLLGAGISYSANVPLMVPLTDRVLAILSESRSSHLDLARRLLEELPGGSHVEHLLSHVGDYAALADRARTKQVAISGEAVARAALDELHREIALGIANTVRWGYVARTDASPEQMGRPGSAITKIDEHRNFIAASFRTARAGLQERRGAVRFFTTNYDTLLEDALALNGVPYWDGFEGGAVAFRSRRLGDGDPPPGVPAQLIKLHGSIDWHWSEDDGRLWRVRYGDTYPPVGQRVLIYPQSTKYLAAQRDPFAAQFDLFRRTLTSASDNVLAICGYSFGDDHINQEIELALSRPGSKTTLIAFSQEPKDGTAVKMPACLDAWRNGPWGRRVYVVSQKGLYVGDRGPGFAPSTGARSWWTFAG
ncbi:MAG: SIR2 family protein, partial [Verrucomicrobia bacterium]|nr:SIR2 family protein [Verrucomicrobiota bacterium]